MGVATTLVNELMKVNFYLSDLTFAKLMHTETVVNVNMEEASRGGFFKIIWVGIPTYTGI